MAQIDLAGFHVYLFLLLIIYLLHLRFFIHLYLILCWQPHHRSFCCFELLKLFYLQISAFFEGFYQNRVCLLHHGFCDPKPFLRYFFISDSLNYEFTCHFWRVSISLHLFDLNQLRHSVKQLIQRFLFFHWHLFPKIWFYFAIRVWIDPWN